MSSIKCSMNIWNNVYVCLYIPIKLNFEIPKRNGMRFLYRFKQETKSSVQKI